MAVSEGFLPFLSSHDPRNLASAKHVLMIFLGRAHIFKMLWNNSNEGALFYKFTNGTHKSRLKTKMAFDDVY
jgi:hypothetical protein